MFTVDLEPRLVIVERPIPECALEPESADLSTPFLRLRESSDVAPEGIVHHLKHTAQPFGLCRVIPVPVDRGLLAPPLHPRELKQAGMTVEDLNKLR